MILTYDPTTVIAIVGTIPLLDWTAIRAVIPDKRDMITGKDGEIARVNYLTNKICTLDIVLPQGSHYNIAMTGVEQLDLPFPLHIYEYNKLLNGGTANDLGLFLQDLASNTVTPVGSQLFLYPCTFMRTPDINYERTNGEIVWRIKGYVRANIQSGHFTDI